MDAGNPLPDALPAPVPRGEKPSGPKHDEFYKYWDRFTRVKEKSKGKKVVKEISVSNVKGRSGSNSTIDTTKNGLREGPSLDKDVEGRPGHPVRSNTQGVVSRQGATTSYNQAAKSCRARVEAIRQECRRLNQKYYDRLFDLSSTDALLSLDSKEQPDSIKPLVGVGSVKRVEDIYDEPEFIIDGATAKDVRQGMNGDCWFLAAITALSGKPELINRLCVHRDEQVGVYGFVFFRDGEWISEVVDDRLCLRRPDDSKNYHTEYMLTTSGDQNPMQTPIENMSHGIQKLPQDFRDRLRKGSNALYFAYCKDSNETWLPLMEKAYAKAHGDYQAIEGGFPGEGIEDLTGGIATFISSQDVLDKDKLWAEMLLVNDKFLFGCGSRQGRDHDPTDDEGFVRGHAYTVLAAREIAKPDNIVKEEERKAIKAGRKYTDTKQNEKLRLLKLRNPWGQQEWNGPWSDGSKEWTPDVMKQLDHTFGDDGIFWISYFDFLKYYPEIDRIRLIGDEWTVTQQWTAVKVPWMADYLETSFQVSVVEAGPVVLILNQPDDRYFQGLVGRFSYYPHFRLYKDREETYLLRSMEQSGSSRSCTAELDLEPGSYTILVKITAIRCTSDKTAEEVFKQFRETRPDKLLALGKSFDAVHSKGKLREMEEADVKAKIEEEKEVAKKNRHEARAASKKQRGRVRMQNARIAAEQKRKNEIKVAAAKEKRKAEKEKKRIEAEEKKRRAEEKKKMEDEKKKGDAAKKDAEEATNTNQGTQLETVASADKSVDEEAKPEASAASEPGTFAGAEKATEVAHDVEPKRVYEKDNTSGSTVSTAPGQPAPGFSPEPSSDGKEPESPEESVEDVQTPSKGPKNDNVAPDDKINEPKDTTDAAKIEPVHDDAFDEQESCHDSEDEAVSEISAVVEDDFDWDSEIDGLGKKRDESESDVDEDDMFKDDPWCARCVIGLRVCSIDKNVVVKVQKRSKGHEEVDEHG